MDKAGIISIEEVCKRCELYTKHCGMLEYPSQCVLSGHFIDGYRRAEKDLALTWEDVERILRLTRKSLADALPHAPSDEELAKEVLKRFNEERICRR